MSKPGNTLRDRSNEAVERERAERQSRGECIDCGKRSTAQRCRRCYLRVETNTERYVGQPRKGRMPKIGEDLADLNYAVEALGKALRGFQRVAELDEPNPRRRRELLLEYRSQLDLARRFVLEVLERNP